MSDPGPCNCEQALELQRELAAARKHIVELEAQLKAAMHQLLKDPK